MKQSYSNAELIDQMLNQADLDIMKAKTVSLLDNSMFDDGSIVCRTFVLATADDSMVCEFDTIVALFKPEVIDQIKAKLNAEYRYISVADQAVKRLDGTVLEIQWD